MQSDKISDEKEEPPKSKEALYQEYLERRKKEIMRDSILEDCIR